MNHSHMPAAVLTRLRRPISALAACLCVVLAASCGSSTSTTTTGPTADLTRCGVSVSGTTSVPAQGGTGTVNVLAARECAWTASVEGQWLAIRAGSAGQGEGTVEFAAAANPDPITRKGAIVLNNTRADVTQAPAECVITLAESEMALGQAGGTGQVDVRASSQLCTWRAESDVSWIVLRSDPNGRGTAPVVFEVLPATGASRTGSIRVANQRLTVTQSASCSFTIDPSSSTAAAVGGTGTIAVSGGAGCAWTAASQVNWFTVSPTSGQGSGTVTFTVAPNAGAERTGAAIIAGRSFSITQGAADAPPAPGPPPPGPACSFAISPQGAQVPSTGGPGTVAVTASASSCAWQAVSNAGWIQILSGASGTGNGQVTYVVSPSVNSRSGTLTVAGRTFTIEQSAASVPGCTYTVKPLSLEVDADQRREKVDVDTGASCAWTATSNVPWIKIESGASGSGKGEVRFVIDENRASVPRTGTLTVAGQTVTVSQTRK